MTMLSSKPTIYDTARFDDNFPAGIEDHYWFQARNGVLDRALQDAERRGWLPPAASILEVGCGTGVVVAGLWDRGHEIHGAELGNPPRVLAPQRIETKVRAQDLDPAFRATVDALMFLDVIEHVPDDASLITETLAAFPRCRAVVVTVPARPELWSQHDRYYGHFRRYTRRTLRRTLVASGLEPQATRYFFRSLYGAALMIKASGRDRNPVMKGPGRNRIHAMAASVLTLEDRLLGALPLPGLSVLGIGTRTLPST